MPPRRHPSAPQVQARPYSQRGLASLTVVMLLFFVVALAAAYSSRSMIFEQRTTTNQLRSTLAFEAAQGGLEWAIALLNAGRIDASCGATADNSQDTFRQRYLAINGSTGVVTALTIGGGGTLMPSCVIEDGVQRCSCPANGAPSLATVSTTSTAPAFRVRFVNVASKPWTTQIEVNGCTRLDDTCLNFPAAAVEQEGRATITALVTLRSSMSTIPGAAVTSRGDVGGELIAYNTDASVNGITAQSGGDITIDESRLRSLAGTPGLQSRYRNDTSFASAALPGSPKPIGERFFASFFGMWPDTYREQPAVVVLSCGGACNDGHLRTAIANNPGRLIWVPGNLSIDGASDIGATVDPVMIVLTGSELRFNAPATINGIVYVNRNSSNTPPDFELHGTGQIRGALISEHTLDAEDDSTIVYDKTIANILRISRGSFVMVPGSWKDF